MPKSKLFKKKKDEAPDELPDLAVDELKKDLDKALASSEEGDDSQEVPAQAIEENTSVEQTQEQASPAQEETEEVVEEVVEEAPNEEVPAQEETEEVVEEVVEETPNEEETETLQKGLSPDKSYFNNLLKELDSEHIDIDKLNQWYKEKFPKGDALEDMKEYWEDKKDELILQSIGKDYKEKIATNMATLQKLEGEWQKIYFDLITKEEEMKNQEKKLRTIIKEFTEIVKRRKSERKEEPFITKKKKTSKKSKR